MLKISSPTTSNGFENPNHRRVGDCIVHPPWWLTNAATGTTPKGDTEDVIVSYIPSWVTAHISLSRYLDIAGNLTTLKASLRSGSQYVKDLNGHRGGIRTHGVFLLLFRREGRFQLRATRRSPPILRWRTWCNPKRYKTIFRSEILLVFRIW